MRVTGLKSGLLVPLLLVSYCLMVRGSRLDRPVSEYEKRLLEPKELYTTFSRSKRALEANEFREDSTSRRSGTSHPDNNIRLDFDGAAERKRSEEEETNCTKSDENHLTGSADLICQPKVGGFSQEKSSQSEDKRIEVTIVSPDKELDSGAKVASAAIRRVDLGSTDIIQCRFNLVQFQPSNLDLKFKLRWLRSVASPSGYQNHSISADNEEQSRRDQVIITSEDKRSWTVQREGGLDLFISDFKLADEGDYFCQALTLDDKSRDPEEPTILDEKRIHLITRDVASEQSRVNQLDYENSLNRDTNIYSQDNLEKLLPSLQVVPEYSEAALGERVQLACVTQGLDPDPDPERIEWSFEPFGRPGFESANSRSAVNADLDPLPGNCSRLGNVVIIWAMSRETVGLFKCTYRLEKFNLTTEVAGELMLRPSVDSAPLVFVTPELLRVSANGSATIQCETTGYPVPQIQWYRLDVPNSREFKSATVRNDTSLSKSKSLSIEHLDGIEVRQLNSRDAMAFCEQSGCLAINNNRLQGKTTEVHVTGLSIINIEQARAHHQGQYVCISSNKHGQNQASALVDVEYKEAPVVRIEEEFKQQTIVLEANAFGQPARMQSATFKCSVEAGQPTPRLKWFRTTSNGSAKIKSGKAGANFLIDRDRFSKTFSSKEGALTGDMDIFDLTRVSSATSKVSTHYENNDKTLTLHMRTISVDDEGDYVCVGENELGQHCALARLLVRKPAQVSILQTSPHIFRPNESFQLDCLASGHPAPLDIEWSRSDRGAFFALISQHSSPGSSTSAASSNGAANQERAVLKFERVTGDDAGEYTCAARDPLNSSVILTDTIMLMLEEQDKVSPMDRWNDFDFVTSQKQLPKLMIRPTRVNAEVGANITLDCLAISGLQPTIVEWLAPASLSNSLTNVSIKPYYRSGVPSEAGSKALLQLGSKLRIINLSKEHEGVYQCKGRNKIGVENAPALVKVLEQSADGTDTRSGSKFYQSSLNASSRETETKTKIAKLGSNIELRCQVNGMLEQPATSWSRDGRELPPGSVQIGHNLWIQNLSKSDEGLYLCSARSNEPNQIIQARINLLVRGSLPWLSDAQLALEAVKHDPASLSAKIVASKSNPNLGDSITLECLISLVNRTRQEDVTANASDWAELEELERQVVWTNLHSGQRLFQDNVYIQNNLLIIYDLRRENSATYRCHYNDLLQHTDYRLLPPGVADNDSDRPVHYLVSNDGKEGADEARGILNIDERRVKQVRSTLGERISLECSSPPEGADAKYFWTRGSGASWSRGLKRRRVGRESQPLVIESLDTSDADLYQCNRLLDKSGQTKVSDYFLLQIETVAARFVQRPVSFVSLPTVKDADYQLELEIKFLPEQADGLLLFCGGSTPSSINSTSHQSLLTTRRSNLDGLNQPDYISLGLVSGHLEFKFELGDGTTHLKSALPLDLHQWHRVFIERNRRSASMWIDGHTPVSNSSPGKFFNLNLDSLLYVGGHQVFLNSFAGNKTRKMLYNHDGTSSGPQTAASSNRNFYGYAQGFQGCISSLSINGRQLDLMARNRAVSMGIFECDRSECVQKNCTEPQGMCQVERSAKFNSSIYLSNEDRLEGKRRQSSLGADLRCVCLPPFHGHTCNQTFNATGARSFLELASSDARDPSIVSPDLGVASSNRSQLASCDRMFVSNQKSCSLNGTSQCQPQSSSSFKCHCRLGFGGELCEHQVNITSDTSIWFNQQAFVHLGLVSRAKSAESTAAPGGLSLQNESDTLRSTTFTDQLNISLRVQTRSSYGLLFYNGPMSDSQGSTAGVVGAFRQVSKSVLANLLARLSSGANRVADFLALSLVDGHAELSFELGSGVVVLRTTRRINDGLWHQIDAFRTGKQATLVLDNLHKYEAQSPGKLSALNTPPHILLGGLPTGDPVSSSSSPSASGLASSLQLLNSFSGCLADLRINSLGPIALTHTDQVSQLFGSRNLLPCKNVEQLPETLTLHANKSATMVPEATSTPPAPSLRLTRKPTKAPTSAESDSDDPDELAAAAAAA